MNSWINFTAIGDILVVGLLAGAGLPALVAIGLRILSVSPARNASGSAVEQPAPGPARIAVAGVCFAVVLAAIGYGIYLIVKSGHPH